jgi:predicted metalloprotease with PDZ domain
MERQAGSSQSAGSIRFAEGVTDYYASILTRRAGLRTEREFLSHWRNAIQDFQNNSAQTRVTAEESSRRVWETKSSYGFGGLSYYQKGAVIGLCLDLKIRAVTNGKKSLDDVMRELLKQTLPPQPGFEEDGILAAINSVTGADFTEFYTRIARTTQPLPFAECLRGVGLNTELSPLPNATPAQISLRRNWMKTFGKD